MPKAGLQFQFQFQFIAIEITMIGTKRYADEGPKVSDCKRDPRLKIHKEKMYSKNRGKNIGYNSKEKKTSKSNASQL